MYLFPIVLTSCYIKRLFFAHFFCQEVKYAAKNLLGLSKCNIHKTQRTVTHCRIALWSHQSAQTASSERCINANSECLSERLSYTCLIYIYIQSILKRLSMYKHINIKIYLTRDYTCTIDLKTNIALWENIFVLHATCEEFSRKQNISR